MPADAAPLFSDGFESGDLGAWSGSTRFGVQQTTVRSGSWAGRASSTGSSSHAWRNITPTDELWATVWFRVESRSSAVWLTGLRRAGGGVILLVGLDGGGKVIVKNRITNATHRSTTTVPAGSWHELEVHAKTASGDRFDVALDGVVLPGLTRADDLGADPIGRFALGDPNKGRNYRVAFDDVSIDPSGGGPSPDDPSVVGEWSEPIDLGVIGVHAILLHTGKILLFYKTVTGADSARLFDPSTGALTDVGPAVGMEYNLFCSAHVTRPDGEVFVLGGSEWQGPVRYGTDQTAYFDPVSETWRVGPPLAEIRWYPSAASLSDGDTLILSGFRPLDVPVAEVELHDDGTETLSTLPASADLAMHYYPLTFLLPDGRLARVGSEQESTFLDPSTATWTSGPSMSTRRYRGGAVLLPGLDRILTMGGGPNDLSPPTVATAEMLDLRDPTPAWEPVASMNEARRNFNTVLLPDGSVFVVGGNRGGDKFTDPIYRPELYDPPTDTWTLMAPHEAPRAYHSTAVLLPDGRVLSSGQNKTTLSQTAEIYSPPYLFAGPRPSITDAPGDVAYGASFEVDTPDAATVDEVVLIRPGSVTHGVNFDQRSVELGFTRGASSLTVDAPASGFEAPPGMYLLFLVRDGVPSIASWVGVG